MATSDHPNFEPLPDSRPVPYDLKKAIEFIRLGGNRKISMADLVARCGVPERTLRKHFRAFMAVSPFEYWRRFRLAAAREVLLKGLDDTSITGVATRTLERCVPACTYVVARLTTGRRYRCGEQPDYLLRR
jgi:transcriptional regulator GlxA family with amidase domain